MGRQTKISFEKTFQKKNGAKRSFLFVLHCCLCDSYNKPKLWPETNNLSNNNNLQGRISIHNKVSTNEVPINNEVHTNEVSNNEVPTYTSNPPTNKVSTNPSNPPTNQVPTYPPPPPPTHPTHPPTKYPPTHPTHPPTYPTHPPTKYPQTHPTHPPTKYPPTTPHHGGYQKSLCECINPFIGYPHAYRGDPETLCGPQGPGVCYVDCNADCRDIKPTASASRCKSSLACDIKKGAEWQ